MLKQIDLHTCDEVVGGIDQGAIERIGRQEAAAGQVSCTPIDWGQAAIAGASGAGGGAMFGGGVPGAVAFGGAALVGDLANQVYHVTCTTTPLQSNGVSTNGPYGPINNRATYRYDP